ncbi:MAG: ABC transporter substrate-binding protein [Planctomycetes bacterium]|nr:ABC transporter substrate-binding protein [Planctomycetota bacterium]
MTNKALLAVLFTAALAAVFLWPRGESGVAPGEGKRIVSLVPSATEILFDMGLGDRVVGVTTYCLYPPEAQQRTVVGDFVSPNIEIILGLRPDVVIESATHPQALARLKAAELPVVEIRVLTLADTLDQYDVIGRATGAAEAAREARARLETALAAEEARWKDAPRLRVALVIERAADAPRDVYVAGGKSFLSELAARAGLDNIFADLPREFDKVAAEEFIRRAPAAILEFRSKDPPTSAESLEIWRKLGGEIPAVRDGRVRVVSDDCMLQPGPRMAKALRILGESAR